MKQAFAERFETGLQIISLATKEAIIYLAKHASDRLPESLQYGYGADKLQDDGNAAESAAQLVDDGNWATIGEIVEAADEVRDDTEPRRS